MENEYRDVTKISVESGKLADGIVPSGEPSDPAEEDPARQEAHTAVLMVSRKGIQVRWDEMLLGCLVYPWKMLLQRCRTEYTHCMYLHSHLLEFYHSPLTCDNTPVP